MGGVVPGIHSGYFRRAIARASYAQEQKVESGERTIVGVNAYEVDQEDYDLETLRISAQVEEEQCERLTDFRRARDGDAVNRALDAIRASSRNGENVMPALIDGALAQCSLGEMIQAMADVYGRYVGPAEA